MMLSKSFMLPGKGMECFPVFGDNQGAARLPQNPVSNSNTKHVQVCHSIIRELFYEVDISVIHRISTYRYFDEVLAFDLIAINRRFLMNLIE